MCTKITIEELESRNQIKTEASTKSLMSRKTKKIPMKNFKTLLIFAISLTIAVASCKKDEVSKSRKELLTAKQWKFTSSKTNGVADILDACEKDDFVIFSSNGTYTYNPVTIKCSSYDTIDTGNWTLSSDEKTLSIDGDEATIVELTESRLVVSTIDAGDIWEQTFIAF